MEVLQMGILRKYLWLVLPIIFFANYANADTCENDPYACTPAKLCSKTTEKINNVLHWISSEEDKHLKVARKINLNCGAKDAMSSCQKDASECSILELCEVAATKEVSATNWNEINPQHVKLAKSFGLDCGVSHSAVSNTSTSPCDENPSACISEALCEKATHDGFGKKEWRTGYYKNYVKEAKQRGLTCGVKSTSIDKTCSQDVLKCTPFELCKLATKKNANGKNIWSMAEYRKKYIEEAQRRNISCGVNYTKNAKTCSQDVLKCTPSELCDAATYTINKITEWKVGAYKKYVKEAKRRNISCGVKSANNKQVKADEKARLALKAEKKRKADEKARLALKAEEKRKADEKARLALKAEEKRKADEKARIALKSEEKRKADEKARIALKAEEKRKADEKARIALEAKKKRISEMEAMGIKTYNANDIVCSFSTSIFQMTFALSNLSSPCSPGNFKKIKELDFLQSGKHIIITDAALISNATNSGGHLVARFTSERADFSGSGSSLSKKIFNLGAVFECLKYSGGSFADLAKFDVPGQVYDVDAYGWHLQDTLLLKNCRIFRY
jgi:hypothetical protein